MYKKNYLDPVTISPVNKQATVQTDWAGNSIVCKLTPFFQKRTVLSSSDVTNAFSP